MAVRTWAGALGSAAGTGVAAGAGQLGLAYGLGIVRWNADFTESAWHFQVTWLALLAAVAVIVGAAVGRWSGTRSGAEHSPPRLIIALAAAIGAAVMIPLVWHPARAALMDEMGSPALIAVIATAVGLLLGVVAATAAMWVPPVAGNVAATCMWLWLAAALSAAWTIGRGDAWGTARPGLLPAAGTSIPLLLLGVPALIALIVAAVARFGGSRPVPVAVSGATGPAVLAAAYVIGAPGGGVQATAYRYALVAVAVGGAVSVLVALVRRPAGGYAGGAHPELDGGPDSDGTQPGYASMQARGHRAEQPGHRHAQVSAHRSEQRAGRRSEQVPDPTGDPFDGVPTTPARPGGLVVAAGAALAGRGRGGTGPRQEPDTQDYGDEESWPGAHRLPAWTDVPEDSPWPGYDEAPVGPSGRTEQPTAGPVPARGWSTGGAPARDRSTGTRSALATPGAPDAAPQAGTGRAKGRWGRRRGREPAGQPLTDGDSEYVNWVRTLGGRGSA